MRTGTAKTSVPSTLVRDREGSAITKATHWSLSGCQGSSNVAGVFTQGKTRSSLTPCLGSSVSIVGVPLSSERSTLLACFSTKRRRRRRPGKASSGVRRKVEVHLQLSSTFLDGGLLARKPLHD